MPSELYKDGLQRDLFLPAIDSIKKNLMIINISQGVDYRQIINKSTQLPIENDDYDHKNLEKYFLSINGSNYKTNESIWSSKSINKIAIQCF